MWVQVPSSAVKREQKCSLFCALAIRHARTNMGTDAESSLSCGCTHGWPHTADAATVPSREAAQGPVGMADCFIPLSAWRIASYNSSNAEKSCRICDSFFFVEPTGLEPMTSRTSSGRSSQLSYGSIFIYRPERDSGTDGARTRDLSRVRRTLIPAELRFHDPVRFSLTSPSEYLCILLH